MLGMILNILTVLNQVGKHDYNSLFTKIWGAYDAMA